MFDKIDTRSLSRPRSWGPCSEAVVVVAAVVAVVVVVAVVFRFHSEPFVPRRNTAARFRLN